MDRFGRVQDYLRISLTERCNLRCFYCMPEEGIPLRDRSEFMSTEELMRITETFVNLGVRKIRLTGGEPLLKKNVSQIIFDLAALPIDLAITTNGILLDTYAPLLEKTNIRNINVSLDSLKKERFNAISRRDYFDRIIGNIRNLISGNFNVKINVVLIKGVNDDEIIDFVDWSVRENVHVRFIEFMPFDGNHWNTEKKVSLNEVLECVQQLYGHDNVLRRVDALHDTARNYNIAGAKGTFAVIGSVTHPFCSSCNRLRLTADGKMKNCLFAQNETDLLGALRDGKEITPLIMESVAGKAKERGGLGDFETNTSDFFQNRSMVRIGG